jgi:predicted nucleic acid-binding protein
MPDRSFFDTNIFVYSLASGDPRKVRAEALLQTGGLISVQVLNEFVSVAWKKMAIPWADIRNLLEAFRYLCGSPLPLTIKTHETALRIGESYGYRIYDALLIASALEARCGVLYSEDMQDGQVVDDQLTIRNPFVGSMP